MNRISRLALATITCAGSTVMVKNYLDRRENKLNASWTNTYEPSVKWDNNWDRRDPISVIKNRNLRNASLSSLEQGVDAKAVLAKETQKAKDDFEVNKKSTKAKRHLFLIRHGQYNMKTSDPEEMILTELGREQADLTGQRLKDLSSLFKFTKLHHSTMVRAVETADIIRNHLANDLPVNVDPMLCEGAPIPPEPPVGHWKPEFYQFFQDGGRIEAAFRKYFYRAPPEQLEDSFEIVVCHANVIRYFFCRALQFPGEAWLRFGLSHGSISHIIINPDGRVSCKFLGDAGYMPVSKTSS